MSKEIQNRANFKVWIKSIKDKILTAQTRASFEVNAEMLKLYWGIGNSILVVQNNDGWGSQVIDNLSKAIKEDFPNSTGFSVRNLKYMRSFAKEYPHFPIVQVPLAQNSEELMQVSLAQITWYHHITLLTKVKELEERVFYIVQTAQNEWSRDVMLLQIKSNLYNMQCVGLKIQLAWQLMNWRKLLMIN
jgi:predicted nuclease of restriction endonuclease-like (RecB) superfamily